MLASEFLEDCRDSREERAGTAEATAILDVDVARSSDRSYGVLEMDTVKVD
jgi:hypothetical protein